ncbi:hypothetical protein AB204_03415 [Xenorhabdus khoisanae]|uniref:Uncharacterized protein n=1 Tax=Xenorhabdus khoisanae TaxID=880157 RepID=A0A0J5FX02_9GAMM|nr:hypothetical protein AB204_03415 [Xenorhabdus khoisanae]
MFGRSCGYWQLLKLIYQFFKITLYDTGVVMNPLQGFFEINDYLIDKIDSISLLRLLAIIVLLYM